MLRGPLGLRRGTIGKDEPRRVIDRSRETWMFGVPRKLTVTWCEIEAARGGGVRPVASRR